jgi:hypothetical protein
MPKAVKQPTPPVDPSTMTEEQLRAYVAKLESALGSAMASPQVSNSADKPWEPGEKRYMFVPLGPTGQPISINGRRYRGRTLVTKELYDTIKEIHGRAVKSELDRMAVRGNLATPELLPTDDVVSRSQPTTIAHL